VPGGTSLNTRQRTTLVAAVCLVFSLAASVAALRRVDRIRPGAPLEDALYVTSPNIVKRASLGYNGLMACIYWTRAVQYFGERHFAGMGSYNDLAPLLEIATHLDPQLAVVYHFGASFLAPKPPGGAGEPVRAIQLMEYGIQNNPNDWHLYYDLGFVYYTELKNYPKASEAFARGAAIPGAHLSLRILAARMAEHGGDIETARILWTETLESNNDGQIKANAAEHLRGLKVDEDVIHLQDAIAKFEQQTGRLPITMFELVSAEGIAGIPEDPDGSAYLLTLDGHIQLQHPDDFPFATRGFPPGYKAPIRPTFHVKF
jgi:tetratricopeptide (TPR) repeat protein